jgi:hypothetical protein
MKTTEHITKLVEGSKENYSEKIRLLDSIQDDSILKHLAEHAEDDWIRLESAIKGNVISVLQVMINHPDERIGLEAAIELNDQKRLTEILLTSKDQLLCHLAANYIDDDTYLRIIIEKSERETEVVDAAIRLGDSRLNRELISKLKNEYLQLKIAQYISDFKEIARLSENAKDIGVREMALNWLLDYKLDDEFDID